jgi:hypothetical protein
VCWIQDHLPQLKSPAAARAVTSNDFVLTDAGGVYASTFGYPRRQLIGLNKLTRIPAVLPPVDPRGDDLVFVSNASYVPDELVRERAAAYDGSVAGRALLAVAGERVIDRYGGGGHIATWMELLTLVRQVAAEQSLSIASSELESIAAWLFHPLNDALYRQQALTWAADAAEQMGVSLGLYGKGWEKHPRFAAHARGPVAYGDDLQRLTRRGKINLQIVPYLCLHQRLLDGLAAGGFFLVREHPADVAIAALFDFVCRHAGPAVRKLSVARAAVSPHRRSELDRLVQSAYPAIATSAADDPVEIAAQWAESQLICRGEGILPAFDQISFNDTAGLRRGIERFIADPAARDRVGQVQRTSIIERFSYVAGIERVMNQVRGLLAQDAANARLREERTAA